MPGFEVRYLNIVWENKAAARKVECAEWPLELLPEPSGYSVESTTYRHFQPYLALSIGDKELLHTPYAVTRERKKKELLPIVDPKTLKTWWILSDGWDRDKHYHLSELYRTVGNVNVTVQKQNLLVRNNSSSFTVEQLESFLRDFKNELWQIILSSKGYITGNVSRNMPGYVNDELVHLLKEFTKSVERALKNPAIELRETQALVGQNAVRPIRRTFMELAAKGAPAKLTSRSYVESKDTAENRYLNYAVSRAIFLTRQLIETTQKFVAGREKFEEHETKRLELLDERKKIDKAVYDNEIAELCDQLEAAKSKLRSAAEEARHTGTSNVQVYTVKLTKELKSVPGKYWCKYLDKEDFEKKHKSALVVELPESFSANLVAHPGSEIAIRLSGQVQKSRRTFHDGRPYFLLAYDSISSLQLLEHPLQSSIAKMRSRRSDLEKTGWVTSYTPSEKRELKNEKDFITKRMLSSRRSRETANKYVSQLTPILSRLQDLSKKFSADGIGKQSNFPNKMVFVQNPNYSTAKGMFFRLREIGGLDEKTSESLMAIDEIGLVNFSDLYEKWCLLKIIGILTEIFGFEIEGHWQDKLINSVSKRQYNIEFLLESKALKRRILLTYEKELSSGVRPDFVLDISDLSGGESTRHVIDAKFKDHLNQQQLEALVQELYSPDEKNYSEHEDNTVFVLHASTDVIKNRTSPLEWGKHSDYGQNANHKQGAVYLSPSSHHGNSVNNLQRLIGQILQKSTRFSFDEKTETIQHNAFCIACGNSDPFRLTLERKRTQGGNEKWSLQCMECKHLHVRNVCAGCGHKLEKNGQYWTYHRTRAEEPFNIVCPACQKFL